MTDLPGVIEDDEYGVLLPQTDRAGAEIVAARLAASLKDYAPAKGIAVFPEDGPAGHEMLKVARHFEHQAPVSLVQYVVNRQ